MNLEKLIKRFKQKLTTKEKRWLKGHPGKLLPIDEKLLREISTDKS